MKLVVCLAFGPLDPAKKSLALSCSEPRNRPACFEAPNEKRCRCWRDGKPCLARKRQGIACRHAEVGTGQASVERVRFTGW